MTKEMGVRSDPAIERWAHMRENTHLTYRMNRKNALIGFVLLVAIPVAIGYSTIKSHDYTDNRFGLKKNPMFGRGLPINETASSESEH